MRTTISLDDDVAARVDQLRREQGIGLSAAVNQLARRGLVAGSGGVRYHHRVANLGLKLDVADVAQVLEHLDES